jgi:hypothetical protein
MLTPTPSTTEVKNSGTTAPLTDKSSRNFVPPTEHREIYFSPTREWAASVVQWPEFLATDPRVPGFDSRHYQFSDQQWSGMEFTQPEPQEDK